MFLFISMIQMVGMINCLLFTVKSAISERLTYRIEIQRSMLYRQKDNPLQPSQYHLVFLIVYRFSLSISRCGATNKSIFENWVPFSNFFCLTFRSKLLKSPFPVTNFRSVSKFTFQFWTEMKLTYLIFFILKLLNCCSAVKKLKFLLFKVDY